MLQLISNIDIMIAALEAFNNQFVDDEIANPTFKDCVDLFTDADKLYLDSATTYVNAANSKEAAPKDFDDLGVAIDALASTICELKFNTLSAIITKAPEEAI